MLWRKQEQRILAYGAVVDLRKSIDGLLGIVSQEFEENGLSGDWYLFLNRRRNLCKIIFWDRTGWCILLKRIEHGHFELRRKDLKQELVKSELELLLDGVLRTIKI